MLTSMGPDPSYAYDNDDNIVGISDGVDATRSIQYGYDNVGRLGQTVAASGAVKRFDFIYDKNGNRTSVEQRTNAADASPVATDTYALTAGTNRLASITSAAGVRSVAYDARGNTASETRPAGATVATTYDGYGRLLTYTRTGDPAQVNSYNGLDDRVGVTSDGGALHTFVYDGDGRLIGEYGALATAPFAETIWLSPEVANDNQPLGGDDGVGGYAPLAVAVGSGASTAINWVHGNHLGVPIAVTSSTGATVTPTGYMVVGFPGQMKTLSDIYYNRYRDYDSSTGRYVQADPMGLGGGTNDYLYAYGNPLRFTDPKGLGALGGAIGGLAGGDLGCAAGGAAGALFGPAGVIIGCSLGGDGGALLGSAAGSILEDRLLKTCKNGNCPPCTPYSEGTIGYQGPHYDHDHWPIGRPHLNLFEVNQNKSTCKCFWNRKKSPDKGAAAPPARPGWVNLNNGFPPLYP